MNVLNTILLTLRRLASTYLYKTPLDSPKEQTHLEGIIPHLEFPLEISLNNLTYQGNPCTKYKQFLYTLIKFLHDKRYVYRRITHKLNNWDVKTISGKKWLNTSVSSVLKRKHDRDVLFDEVSIRHYPNKTSKMILKYYHFD